MFCICEKSLDCLCNLCSLWFYLKSEEVCFKVGLVNSLPMLKCTFFKTEGKFLDIQVSCGYGCGVRVYSLTLMQTGDLYRAGFECQRLLHINTMLWPFVLANALNNVILAILLRLLFRHSARSCVL